MPVTPVPWLGIRDRGMFAANATLEHILPKLEQARRALAEVQADVDWLESLRDRRVAAEAAGPGT